MKCKLGEVCLSFIISKFGIVTFSGLSHPESLNHHQHSQVERDILVIFENDFFHALYKQEHKLVKL